MDEIIINALSRKIGRIGPGTIGYVTDGGTYIIASQAEWNDDGKPHDLVAILSAHIGDNSRIMPLRPTVNPDLLDALRVKFDYPAGR